MGIEGCRVTSSENTATHLDFSETLGHPEEPANGVQINRVEKNE